MKRLIIFSILFCLYAGKKVQAQVTGYMGKRFTLSYNAHMAPNLNAVLNIDGNSEINVPVRLNTKHIIEAEYVIGRRVSAGLELGFMRHNVPYLYEEKYLTDRNSGYYSTRSKLGEAKLNGFAAGVNFKFYGPFSKNTLAPLGSYLVLTAQRLVYNLNDEQGGTLSEYLYDTTTVKNVTAKNAGLLMGIGFGTRRIYYDKMTLDFAITSGLAVVLPKEESHENAGNFASYYSLTRHALMYKIGIGGLLF
ncbi:MAG: hypothetical protein ACXWEY_00080 [Bacteroidia bacterium]